MLVFLGDENKVTHMIEFLSESGLGFCNNASALDDKDFVTLGRYVGTTIAQVMYMRILLLIYLYVLSTEIYKVKC